MNKTKQRLIWGAFFVFGPLLYAGGMHSIGALNFIENRLLDARYRDFNPGHSFSDRVVILDVDEIALDTYKNEELFGRWPWRRSVYPQIIDHVAGTAGARLFMFDVLLTERSHDLDDDRALVEANQLFPISHALQPLADEQVTPEPLPGEIASRTVRVDVEGRPRLRDYQLLSLPAGRWSDAGPEPGNIAASSPLLHSVSYVIDPDGISRRANFLFRYGEHFFPALSLRGLLALYDEEPAMTRAPGALILPALDGEGDLRVPLADGGYLLNYYPADVTREIPRVSVSAVIEDQRSLQSGEIEDPSQLRAPLEAFTDKVVIFGTSAAATHDTKITPFGPMPGYILHATMLSNLINGDFLRVLPVWTGFLGALILLPLIVALIMFGENMTVRVVAPLGLFLGYMVIGMFLFRLDLVLSLAPVMVTAPASLLASLGYLTFVEGAEKRKFSRVLKNMVDPTIVSEALNDLEALKEGGEKDITAFFSDVASFSTISEQLSSHDLAALLNEYLSAMTLILKHHRGTLDKYIGDAVVGIFGAPVEQPTHDLDAARASLEMIERLQELKAVWQRDDAYSKDAQQMNIRIGLNSGIAKVGFMGTDELASYTMMGDTVNLAARLEAAAKDYGVDILISHATHERIASEMLTRCLDAVVVKGKTEPVRVYELVGLRGATAGNLVEVAGLYEQGFDLYLKRDWTGAIKSLRESERAKGQADKSVAMLIDRCEDYRQAPPPDDWNGAFVRTHK